MCVYEEGNLWTFSGQVQDFDGATSITIMFSNLPSLNGKSVQVEPDGSFSLTIMLGDGESGLAMARAIDSDGEVSPEVEAFVF
jgi:hypothetical protein